LATGCRSTPSGSQARPLFMTWPTCQPWRVSATYKASRTSRTNMHSHRRRRRYISCSCGMLAGTSTSRLESALAARVARCTEPM
jgi:hypothetical protein